MAYKFVQVNMIVYLALGVISDHATAGEAFDAIGCLSARLVRTGAPRNAVPLTVVDGDVRVARPGAQ